MNKVLRRSLLLISIVLALFVAVMLISDLFCKSASFDERRLGYYANEPKNSIDVLFIGASDIYTGWAPGLAFKEQGFTSYPYCISANPATLWKYMLEEATKKQKTQLVVIDPYGATMNDDDSEWGLHNPAPIYQFLNTIPFSEKKIRMVKNLCSGMSIMDKMSYLFPFVKHHDTFIDFKNNYDAVNEILKGKTSSMKGMRTLTETYRPGDLMYMNNVQPQSINPTAEAVLRDFLNYCNKEKINVLFVHFPSDITSEDFYYNINAKCDFAGEIIKTYGYEYINLQNCVKEIGLEGNEDFYQPSHLNVRGQRKTTVYLCKILSDRYLKNINHSDKKLQAEWKEAYNVYEKYYKYACDCIDRGQSEYLNDGPETMAKLKK